MSDLWDCEHYLRCQNNDKCLRCGPEQRLLKLPTDAARKSSRAKIRSSAVTAADDVSGATLEDYVRDTFNSLPTVKEYQARRQLGSGNIWFMPGDVADTVVLAECKERLTLTAKGEKTMTIPKTMLEKIVEEAKMLNTYPALVFRYKADEKANTYFVQEFEVLAEMVHEIKFLRHQTQELEAERNMYKDIANKLLKEKQERDSNGSN